MSGSLHDVKNSVWMKTVVISVIMLFVGVAGYATFAGGIGTIKHATWEEAEDKAHATEEVWQSYNETVVSGDSDEIRAICEELGIPSTVKENESSSETRPKTNVEMGNDIQKEMSKRWNEGPRSRR